MVGISAKLPSQRSAKAQALVGLPEVLIEELDRGEIYSPKGPVLSTAIVAGTMAVKKTSDLIPFCHPLPIESCKITIRKENKNTLRVECEVKTFSKTGVEMEALTGVSLTCLSIYDMCKSLSHRIHIHEIKLLEKSGGKHDFCS